MSKYDHLIDEVLKRKNEGQSLPKIAEDLDIPFRSIYNLLRIRGLIKPTRKRKIDEEEKNKIENLIKENMSAKRISQITGISYRKVQKYIKEKYPNYKPHRIIDRKKAGKYNINAHYFKDINTEEKAYWLGFIFADGSLARNKLTIRISKKDEDLLHRFMKAIEYDGSIRQEIRTTNHKKDAETSVLQINCTEMIRDLSLYMPIGKKSDAIRVPNIDPELLNHFVRGYFDGDGYVVKDRKNIGFVGNLMFLSQLRSIFEINKLSTNKDGYLRKYNETYGELRYGKIVGSKIMDWMYADSSVYLKRKFDDFYN